MDRVLNRCKELAMKRNMSELIDNLAPEYSEDEVKVMLSDLYDALIRNGADENAVSNLLYIMSPNLFLTLVSMSK